MNELELLKAFLRDIQNNSTALRLLGRPEQLLTEFQNLLNDLGSNQRERDWGIYRLKDKDYGKFEVMNEELRWKDRVGIVQSRYIEDIIGRPVDIKYYDNRFWVLSYDSVINIFDKNFSHIGGFSVYGGLAQSNPLRINGGSALVIDDEMIIVAMDGPNLIKAFNHNGDMLWQFGGVNGNPDSGGLIAPYGVDFLPNGNIIVVDYQARVGGAVSYGVVFELDRNTGSYIKYYLAAMPDRYNAWMGGVYYPTYVKVVQDPSDNEYYVYISYYQYNYIGKFWYNQVNDSLEYRQIYGKTEGINVGAMYPRGFDINLEKRRLYICLNGPNVVAIIDLDNADLIGYVGKSRYEDYNNNPNTPNGFWSLRNLVVVDGLLYIVDYQNQRISVIPEDYIGQEMIALDMELLEGVDDGSVKYVSDNNFDINNKVLRVSLNNLLSDNFSKRVLVLRDY